jgi:hypothetical protein
MGIWICIVEGDGEKEAVPLLLRRIVCEKFQRWETQFRPYNAHGRGNIADQAKFMRILERALREPNLEAVFIVMDSEGDCPKNLAQQLSQWVRQRNPHVPIAIVVAHQCYESWLLAGHCLSSQPETIAPGTAKKLIGRRMGKPYKEMIDQPRLTAQMVIWKAFRRCRSFRRFVHAVKQLIAAIDNQQIVVTP